MYNINYNVYFESNKQYRKCLRDVFYMNMNNIDTSLNEIEDLDDETEDELLYDHTAITKGLDYVFNLTKNNEHFMDLYISAASCFFSEDPNIGISVLFSYDYFQQFHLCLVDFFNNKFDINSLHFKIIKNKFL